MAAALSAAFLSGVAAVEAAAGASSSVLPTWAAEHPIATIALTAVLALYVIFVVFTTEWVRALAAARACLGASDDFRNAFAAPPTADSRSVQRRGLPPQMSVLVPALLGQYSLKANGPLEFVRQGFKKVRSQPAAAAAALACSPAASMPLCAHVAHAAQYGGCFRIKIFGQGITFLVGAEANTVFFDSSDKDVTQREVYKFTVPVFGKNIVYDAEPNIMIQQLKFVRAGLTGNAMKAHAVRIREETEAFFAKWGDSGEVNLQETLAELTVLTASACLLGNEIRSSMHAEVARHYETLERGMTHLSVFFPHLPTKAHENRDKARLAMIPIFSRVIQARRKAQAADPTAEKPNDFLQVLIESKYRDDRYATDEEISGLLLAALFAGQHTSSITSTWMGYLILQQKDKLLPVILDEQRRILDKHGGHLTFDAINEMDFLHACEKETLRLFPPLVLLMRKVQTDLNYKSMVIPKGDIIMTCPPVTHRIDAVYKDPEAFDPFRFMPERNEGAVRRCGCGTLGVESGS
jgi:sterol 14-demethylase